MLYIAKECITHGQVSYSNIQLQLTLSENLHNKTTRCYGYSINKFTKLSCGSPLHKLNHTGKCLSYFHPSYGSDNYEITAESQTIFSYPYYLSVSFCKLKAVKSDNVLAVYIRILMLHFKFVLLTCRSVFFKQRTCTCTVYWALVAGIPFKDFDRMAYGFMSYEDIISLVIIGCLNF